MRERRLPIAVSVVALVLFVPLFAGCLGDKKNNAGASADPIIFDEAPLDEAVNESVEANTTDLFTPKAHFHHYWGDPPVDYVVVFDSNPAGLEFEQFPMDRWGDQYNAPLGFVEFNLESDGDDVTSGEGDSPLNPVTNRADAVFAGTSHLIVNISWATSGADQLTKSGDLRFKYKSACSPLHQPAENAGIQIVEAPAVDGVVHAAPIRIKVAPECADPPHQIAVSRWEFVILTYPDEETAPVNDATGMPLSLALGKINVEIHAQNGGEKAIGEPHPDLFAGAMELQLGDPVSDSFDLVLTGEQPEVRLPTGEVVQRKQCLKADGSGHDDIRMPMRHIVPFQTKELIITVTLTYDAAKNHGLPEENAGAVRLLYHPANHTRYQVAPGFSESGNTQTYTITFDKDKDLSMTDPVYNVDSDWRFGFTLFTNDQPCVGSWAGDYTMSFKAIRNPDIRIF